MCAYELRIYQVREGIMGDLQDLCRDVIMPLMPEYSIEDVGFWATPDERTLYWIVRHDSLDDIATNWDRYHADSRWKEELSAREQGDPFVTDVQSVPLVGAPGLPPDRDAENRKTALAFIQSFLNDKDVDAIERHLSAKDYVQHNPTVEAGIEGEKTFARDFFAANPDLSVEVRRVSTSYDHVFTHSVLKTGPQDRGTAVADVFRFRDGRIVEHWDVIQPIPEKTASGNPMV